MVESYLIQKAYATSTIPLYLQSQSLISKLTNCKMTLSNAVTVSGYSEGGYASIALSETLQNLGMDLIIAQAGGGPYMLSSATLLTTAGKFLCTTLYYLIVDVISCVILQKI